MATANETHAPGPVGWISAAEIERFDSRQTATIWRSRPAGECLALHARPSADLLGALTALLQYEGHRVYCGKRNDDDDVKQCVCGHDDAQAAARAAIAKAVSQ